MALPSAVQKEAEAAERFEIEHGLKPGQKLEGGEQPKSGEQPPAAPVQPVKAQDPPPNTDQDNWETRFKNYKASTDKTIADLRSQLSDSQQQIADSQRQVQELVAKLEAKPAAQPTPTPASSGQELDLDSLPPEIREEYDDDFLRNMAKFMNSQLLSKVGDLRAELDSLKGTVDQVSTTTQKSAQDRFYEDLDKGEAAWESIGQSQAFKDWQLNQISEIDPRTYAQVLGTAMQQFDAKSVLWVLKQYKSSQGSQPDTSGGDAGQNLDHLVTPEGAGSGSGEGDGFGAQVDSWKQSEVDQFFKDVATTGKYTQQEAKAIERQIQAAHAAGKIIPG